MIYIMLFFLLIGECLCAGKNFPCVGQRTLHKCSSNRYFFNDLTFEYLSLFSLWLLEKNMYVYIHSTVC